MKKHPQHENSQAFEYVRCGLCGSASADIFLKTPAISGDGNAGYTLVKCCQCGLVFLNPRPVRELSYSSYTEDDPERAQRKPAFYERFYFYLFRHIPSSRKGALLDVGCGSGRYIYTLRQAGWDAKGVDISPTDYGKKKLGLDIHEGDLLDCKFPSEAFDAVTLWWTLEHVHEPLSLLKETHRILKNDGVCVVGVQNIKSLEAEIFKQYWFHLFLPKHLYHFSPVSLKAILEKAGFKNVRIKYDLFSFGLIGSLQCFFNSKGIKVSFKHPFFYMLSLPFDAILGLVKRGSLITAYAFKK